ncbi:MAG: hypothetical protein COB93_07140 [Sneathiella sp.]|nr:MAG: hypothetical protein COB93_07140 [Sneathiella sp.]
MSMAVSDIHIGPNIQLFKMDEIDWVNVGKPGLFYKPARVDLETGEFLGLFRFDAFTESGVHQHEDVGASYILSGSVTDYSGSFTPGCVGINPPGDTHDAYSYDGVLITSRLEGSSIYPPKPDELQAIHPGAHREIFKNMGRARDPIVVPYKLLDMAVSPDMPDGIILRTLYDYAGTSHDFRMCSLHFDPVTEIPEFLTKGGLDIFVIAGDLDVSGMAAKSNQFVTVAAGSTAALKSRFGCHILTWSENPVAFSGADIKDPFGF